MQSGSDSSDSQYDSSDSRDDSRDPTTRPVKLAVVGLVVNLIAVLVGWWACYQFLLGVLLLPLVALAGVVALVFNVLAVVYGLSVLRADLPPRRNVPSSVWAVVALVQASRKATCRVWSVIALVQVLLVLGLTIAGVVYDRSSRPDYTMPSTPASLPKPSEQVQGP